MENEPPASVEGFSVNFPTSVEGFYFVEFPAYQVVLCWIFHLDDDDPERYCESNR